MPRRRTGFGPSPGARAGDVESDGAAVGMLPRYEMVGGGGGGDPRAPSEPGVVAGGYAEMSGGAGGSSAGARAAADAETSNTRLLLLSTAAGAPGASAAGSGAASPVIVAPPPPPYSELEVVRQRQALHRPQQPQQAVFAYRPQWSLSTETSPSEGAGAPGVLNGVSVHTAAAAVRPYAGALVPAAGVPALPLFAHGPSAPMQPRAAAYGGAPAVAARARLSLPSFATFAASASERPPADGVRASRDAAARGGFRDGARGSQRGGSFEWAPR